MKRQPHAAPTAPARLVFLGMLLTMSGVTALQAATRIASSSYVDLSLEQLMNVDVTSVAGTAEPRMASPAALAVITGDDIRRAGHRTVAEALRMVPGMYVARANASSYVIGARGLTGSALTSTRYLVMVDGRAVHDPLISTAFWDVVDVPIHDIDRIEVIRGPGATLWGANATHGVIKVITRSASETQGSLLSASVGDLHSAAMLRHGWTLGKTALRAYAKYADHANLDLADGRSAQDGYATVRAGVRADHAFSEHTSWTLDAAVYDHPDADATASVPVPGAHLQFEQQRSFADISGAHLLMGLQHDWSDQTGFHATAYMDRSKRVTSRLGIRRDTVDLDLRHWVTWAPRNQLMSGVQFTHHDDHLMNGDVVSFQPERRAWSSLGGFLQNTTEVLPNRLFLMVGSKLTDHDFVGSFAQPGARIWWTPSPQQTLWAAVSRPVRVPSRLEEDGFITLAFADTGLIAGDAPSGVIVPFGLGGNPDLKPERLTAYELGHRRQWGEHLALDVSLFFNDYERYIGVPLSTVGTFTDVGKAETYGAEIAASLRPATDWRVDAAYSYLHTDISGPVLDFDEDNVPKHLAQLRATWDVRSDLESHSAVYYVPAVDGLGVDAYTRLDLGLSWEVRPGLELSVWGQNLAEAEHAESGGVQIPRSVYAQLQLEL